MTCEIFLSDPIDKIAESALESPVMPKKTRPYRTLAEWRKANFRNQEAAAVALSLDQGHYSRIERGLHAPRAPLAKVISDRTGVPLETILGLD